MKDAKIYVLCLTSNSIAFYCYRELILIPMLNQAVDLTGGFSDNVECSCQRAMGLLYGGSGYISLIFFLTYLLQSAWTHCTECTNENKEEILKVCQSSASKLDEAEHLKNASLVCSRFHELFGCVGEKVPQCLDEFSEQYEQYTYSPWNCPMSHEQLMTYQKLVQDACTSKTDTQNSSSISKTETQTSSSVSNSDMKTRPNTYLFLAAALSGVLLLTNF